MKEHYEPRQNYEEKIDMDSNNTWHKPRVYMLRTKVLNASLKDLEGENPHSPNWTQIFRCQNYCVARLSHAHQYQSQSSQRMPQKRLPHDHCHQRAPNAQHTRLGRTSGTPYLIHERRACQDEMMAPREAQHHVPDRGRRGERVTD